MLTAGRLSPGWCELEARIKRHSNINLFSISSHNATQPEEVMPSQFPTVDILSGNTVPLPNHKSRRGSEDRQDSPSCGRLERAVMRFGAEMFHRTRFLNKARGGSSSSRSILALLEQLRLLLRGPGPEASQTAGELRVPRHETLKSIALSSWQLAEIE
ncbi:hypothetical protein EYF80_000693 [Liparis tanakae]|uniref:Uncharacterized protein n=1 Tax=Liparis tanakae TaxID=230148 RepID=A0A4Z2JEZ4_9TELE|nr:hypothetical protein EYF80_000693 [Liparis tanakae]